MIFAITSTAKIMAEMFLYGCSAAISLYCGVKTPKNRRKQW